MHETNTKAHAVVNNIQRQGERQLLGLAQLNDSICDPPTCAAKLETQLKPAHMLRIMARELWASCGSGVSSSPARKRAYCGGCGM
jgi:hypothetical protein